MEKFISDAKNFWETIVATYNYSIENKVTMLFVLAIFIGLILFAIRDAKDNRRTKKEVDRYMADNQKKISEIRIRIMKCDNMKEWPRVKDWAIASANIIRSGIYDIDSNYGKVIGNPLLHDIQMMIFRKEVELIKETFKKIKI